MSLDQQKKFLTRMPQRLYAALAKQAERDNQSVNQVIVKLLSQETLWSHPGNSDRLLAAVREAKLGDHWENSLRGVVLFGSAARDELTQNSDIDVLVVLDQSTRIDRELYRRWDQRYPNLSHQGHLVSVHFSHLPNRHQLLELGSLWRELAIDGIVLWEKDKCISQVLRELRIALLEHGVKRRSVHGVGYWA
jgi:hypothetical protein